MSWRTTCLVSNYNYRAYVDAAVDSVLAQTVPFDEIIVVDDGSTDGSLSHLREYYRNESRVQVVSKQNGGQLSTFNRGFQHATGDLVFFLDADDRFDQHYLAAALDVYRSRDVDFVISGAENFGSDRVPPRRPTVRRDLGYSVISGLHGRTYVGGPTSTLSMRRELAEQILPYPHEQEWRTRADDVLVLGSSIVGARKFHLGAPYVGYRVHGSNNFAGKRRDARDKLHHAIAMNRLIEWYTQRMGYNVARLNVALHREFQTIQDPTLREWWIYFFISWQNRLPLMVRARHFAQTFKHYWSERLARRQEPSLDDSCETTVVDLPAWQGDRQRVA